MVLTQIEQYVAYFEWIIFDKKTGIITSVTIIIDFNEK